MGARTQALRLSEIVEAMSYALDLTEGEPPGHAARTCAIGMRLAEELGLDGRTRSRLFYALLLKDAGCSANSAKMAALFGADDHGLKRSSKRVDWSGRLPAFVWAVRVAAPGGAVRTRLGRLRAIKAEGEVTRQLMRARCDRGAQIAILLGLHAETAEAIRALDEHWDGGGQPDGLRGEEIPLLGRILCLAQTVEIFHAEGGVKAAWRMASGRRGGWFDPSLVDALGSIVADREFWRSLATGDAGSWEPADHVLPADDARIDQIAGAFAGVVDVKSPWTYRHSDRVCLIVMGMAGARGADLDAMRDLRRTALLHDIGKLAISNRILDKQGPLTDVERRAMRRHPLISERILARVPGVRHMAPVAGAHHERLDGGGYPRGLAAPDLTTDMRLLAVADVYEALTADRPYRRALPSDVALARIRREVPERLDPEAFSLLTRLVADEQGEGGPVGERRAHAALDPGLR